MPPANINVTITRNDGDAIRASLSCACALDNRILDNGDAGIGSGACGNNPLVLNEAGDETCSSVLSTSIQGGAPCPWRTPTLLPVRIGGVEPVSAPPELVVSSLPKDVRRG